MTTAAAGQPGTGGGPRSARASQDPAAPEQPPSTPHRRWAGRPLTSTDTRGPRPLGPPAPKCRPGRPGSGPGPAAAPAGGPGAVHVAPPRPRALGAQEAREAAARGRGWGPGSACPPRGARHARGQRGPRRPKPAPSLNPTPKRQTTPGSPAPLNPIPEPQIPTRTPTAKPNAGPPNPTRIATSPKHDLKSPNPTQDPRVSQTHPGSLSDPQLRPETPATAKPDPGPPDPTRYLYAPQTQPWTPKSNRDRCGPQTPSKTSKIQPGSPRAHQTRPQAPKSDQGPRGPQIPLHSPPAPPTPARNSRGPRVQPGTPASAKLAPDPAVLFQS